MTRRTKLAWLWLLVIGLGVLALLAGCRAEPAPEPAKVASALRPPSIAWDYAGDQRPFTRWELCINGRCRKLERVDWTPRKPGEPYEVRTQMTVGEAIAVSAGAEVLVKVCKRTRLPDTSIMERCTTTPLVR